MSLSWGVIPIKVDTFGDTDQMFRQAESWVLQHELARPGDLMIVTAGVPLGVSGTTNLVIVIEITEKQ